MDVLKAILLTGCLFLFSGCQVTYYLKNAYSQISMLNSQVPIEKALKDPKLTEEQKKKLILSQEVREFAESELHLKNTDNYTGFVQLDRPYVTYVVSAAQKWRLEPHLWRFPIVGEAPYKGYFNEADAKEEEQNLKAKDLDTYLRGVSAFSLLGWFRDPFYSSMLSYSETQLVNTLIHETVHATLYIKSSADFNERLAVFLGNKGMELFYLKTEGPDSPNLKKAKAENEDDKVFSKFISEEINALEEWYKTQDGKDEELRTKRIKEIQTRFQEKIESQLKSKYYSKFPQMPLNNARLLMYKTYMQDLGDFEKVYQQSGSDFGRFLERCKTLQNSKNPEEDLKKMIVPQS
jgi:predicted aminopeptidase